MADPRGRFLDKRIEILCVFFVVGAILLSSVSVGVAVFCLLFSSFAEQLGAVKLVISDFKIITSTDKLYLLTTALAVFLLSICFGLFFIFFIRRMSGNLDKNK
ncbi:MAG: hypothetical protein PHI86_05255 [Candidatus Omnitrophica bacterium]|nr:hypothetical protein [Candidatus Omnitrophota bacterium]